MRIKRLDITGFKSFMEKSVFSFDDHITGIVGPNGCGKSNVVDAIRWSMGEQSAKNLRGRGMEDVIFNGSESKAPLNMAEVSLTFSVEGHDVLPQPYAGFPEITVTRRLFRSGESEYLINKSLCRLLDITELFLGTGVGTKAYSIIEQGRVGLIVSSKPEDRRSLIEEAAGVTKYKSRRRAAERKMEYTQQNLLRVTDLVAELEKRLDALSRQAKKAEKYKKLKARTREIELHLASHRFIELSAEHKELQAKLEGLTQQEHAHLTEVRDLEQSITTQRLQLDADTGELQALQERLHALESELQRDEQNLAYWEADSRQTQEQRIRATDELAQLTVHQAELADRRAELDDALVALTASWETDEGSVQRAQQDLKDATLSQTELSLRLEQERGALLGLAARVANHESNLHSLARQRADLETRRYKTATEMEALRSEASRVERVGGEISERVNGSRQLTLELAEKKSAEEETLARDRKSFSENEVHVIALREELGDKRSRLSSLEEIQRQYEGFDRGVRAVMLAAGESPRSNGIYGSVADVLSTSPRFEKAVEAALGDRLQHVLVEDSLKGFALMDFLKVGGEGRGSFVPLHAMAGKARTPAPDLAFPGVLGAAWEEVRCEETFLEVARALLEGVVFVEDLAAAKAYAASGGGGFTLVTLEGELLRADGVMTGGVLEGPAVGALQKKREVQELTEEVARLSERYQETLTRHHALQKQILHTEEILKGLAKNQHQEELNLASQEKDLHRAVEDLTRVRQRLFSLTAEDAQLTEALRTVELESGASRDEVGHAQADRAGREERVKELSAQMVTLREAADVRAAELTTLKVTLAAHTERLESTRRELSRIDGQQREVTGRIDKLQGTLVTAAVKLEELNRGMEEVRESSVAARTTREHITLELEERRCVHAEASGHIREQDARLKVLRASLDELTSGLSQVSLRERELMMELTHLLDGVRERHQTELTDELQKYPPEAAKDPQADSELKDLRGQLERMGEINLTAIEEHAEVEGRFTFLSTQKNDLDSSLQKLQEAIVKIDKTSRERFNQTFHLVNEKFQAIFPRLFGGGRAGLLLTEEGPNGEQGVEIIAQPPGKKLQSVMLLSGGEKALTAVGLIFAIFLLKPTPFCLLDEVDAPLDEGNVGRYNDMVREMSKQSQFILITHNKRTMETVDTLYGVTMEEPGISKLVAVKMTDAVAANDNQAA